MDQTVVSLSESVASWWLNAGWEEALEAFFVAMSVIGQHHIAKRQVKGFYFWIAGNLAALVLFVSIGRWVTAVLYVYFLVMSLRGVRLWKALDHTPPVRVVQARGL